MQEKVQKPCKSEYNTGFLSTVSLRRVAVTVIANCLCNKAAVHMDRIKEHLHTTIRSF